MRNRVFFPQEALNLWLAADRVELTGKELTIKAEGRRYRIVDAIRVLREVTGGDDVYDIVGRVKSVSFLTELGAELLGSSMLIGDSAYDVIPGFVGAPVGSFAEHRAAATPPAPDVAPRTDEELLAQYLAQALE